MKRKQLSVLILAICSSGAASANDAGIADISPVKTLPPELVNSFNWWQPMVGAKTAYTLGARGLGIKVAVIDTGIDLNHREFAGRIVPGYNALSPRKAPMDDNGHGTHVAGIIGAAADGRMTVGIAPDVSLMPVKVLNSQGSGTQTAFNAGVNYAVKNGARILNMSLGASGPFGQQGMQQAVSAGQLVVAAAGNSGGANPGWPARYAKESWANGQIIAVGAVDQNGIIASFSNRAGDTKYSFVVAPGVKIGSTYLNGQYVYMSGTSMAAPIVSGVAADIWSNWMYLKANQVSSIIFQTATHMGTSAIGTPDEVYGWGMVNLEKALQPVGTLMVASSSSSKKSYVLKSSTLSTNSLIRGASFNGLSLAATDDFGRDYSYDVGTLATKPEISSIDTLLERMDKQMSMVESTSPTSSLTMSLHNTPTEMQKAGDPFAGPTAVGDSMPGFNFVQKFGCQEQQCQREYAIGTHGFIDQYFGLPADYKNLPLANNFSNPYFQFAGTASHVAMGQNLGAGYKLKMGFLNTSGMPGNQTLLNYSSDTSANGWISEIEKKFEGGVFRVAAGDINENHALLGATGTEAFAMDVSRTRFVSLSGAYGLMPGTSLLAQVSLGNTSSTGDAVIQDSEAKTQSWSLGLVHQEAWRKGDKLAFSIAQPMKVTAGLMNLALPTVDPVSGEGGFDFTRASLVSDRVETDVEMGYMMPVFKDSSLRLIAAYKMNQNNEAGNAKVLGMRYQMPF